MKRILLFPLFLIALLSYFSVTAQDNLDIPSEIPGDVVYIPFPVDIALDGHLGERIERRVGAGEREFLRDPARPGQRGDLLLRSESRGW